MKTVFLFVLALSAFCVSCFSQSYSDSIYHHREKYRQEFLTDTHSPLKEDDTAFLRFFAPDKKFRMIASFERASDSLPFEMHTHSGKVKMYRKYGRVCFRMDKKKQVLEVYQSLTLLQNEEMKDYLFIPFNDLTNYETTYAGGRYMDISIKDIKNEKVLLDFNKCYNPYCAYASGYSCPIPPDANKLQLKITAGEKLFGKEVYEE